MKKILILVLSSNTYPSKRNEKTIKSTWVRNLDKNIEVLFYKAGNVSELVGNQLNIESDKSTSAIGYKTLEAFKWSIENMEFDYLFRTNTSSYINTTKLLNFVNSNLNHSNFLYHGVKMFLPKNDTSDSVEFISGAGILFSRKTIELIIQHRNEIDLNEKDDVSIGKLLNKYNIPLTQGNRFDIKGNIYKQNIETDYYHYRCRLDNHYGYPRFLEKYAIKELHNIVLGYKITKSKKIIMNILFEISKKFYIQYPFWSIYNFCKNLLNKVLPKNLYSKIKNKFSKVDNLIKLRYFKK